jgi:hypothetical protein
MFEKRRMKKGAVMKATQSFAQDRGTGATPAAGAKAGATQGTFMTSDAIPWKPADPREPDGVQMFVVWGNPKEGPSGVLLKFPECDRYMVHRCILHIILHLKEKLNEQL